MSYSNPNIPVIPNPVGLEQKIQDIQNALSAGLSWLEKSFGRAWIHQEKDPSGKVSKIPKAYAGLGEYINVLPNDNFKSQSFIMAKGYERFEDYNHAALGIHKKRDLHIIFWGNLKKIDLARDYIFTEELKKQIQLALNNVEGLIITGYFDERADQVFADFTLNDVDTQLLMFPYFACKFDVTVNYFDAIC